MRAACAMTKGPPGDVRIRNWPLRIGLDPRPVTAKLLVDAGARLSQALPIAGLGRWSVSASLW